MHATLQALTQALTGFVGRLKTPGVTAPNDLPRLSIITPSYNQAKFLERTIISVLNQGYPRLEFIIMDGGSTDGSVDIIKKYEKYLSYWESTPDRGQSHALNKGFMRATGDYVGWQNSDDLYFADCLLKLGRTAASTGASIVSGNLLVADANNQVFRRVHYTPMTRRQLTVVKASIPNQAAIFRRDVLARHGYVDENMRFCMDLELWSRLLKEGENVIVPDAYGVYTSHEETKTYSMKDVLRSERAAIIAAIRAAEPGLGRLYPWLCKAGKLAAHARQGDFPYLFEKMLSKMAGKDNWNAY